MESERELVRRAREVAAANGGSPLETARWLGAELGLPRGAGEEPHALRAALRSIVWQAFRITYGQAQLVLAWSGLDRGGRVDEAGLDLQVGRLLPRTEELDAGVVDRARSSARRPRRMVLKATQDDLPVRLPGEFRLLRYGLHRLLVLRGRPAGPGGDGSFLDVEFESILGMRVRPEYRDLVVDHAPAAGTADGADAEAVAAMDALVPPTPGGSSRRLLLRDGDVRDFVVCRSVGVYRFDPREAAA
ncbi:hypothetical protein ABT093_18640 [Kitasatospora sp. NPDC002551]|uniref:hypothetical protein n=1 Tax=unclassified Kitasatospora TaxID=2633591 RepID=UPI00332B074A